MTTDFLDTLELSVRATNVLRNYGYTTREKFLSLTQHDVSFMRGAGARTWKEIYAAQCILLAAPDAPTDKAEDALLVAAQAVRDLARRLAEAQAMVASLHDDLTAERLRHWPAVRGVRGVVLLDGHRTATGDTLSISFEIDTCILLESSAPSAVIDNLFADVRQTVALALREKRVSPDPNPDIEWKA